MLDKAHKPQADPILAIPTCIVCGKRLTGLGTKNVPWRHKDD